jgi:hypothetical protein
MAQRLASLRSWESSLTRFQCLDGFALKLIALVTMTIDHLAATGLVGGALYLPMRAVGRIAFPIYCFLLTEGFRHTRSRERYLGRLLFFALLSEAPFDQAFFSGWFDRYNQSVMLTLAIGLVVLWAMESAEPLMNRLFDGHPPRITVFAAQVVPVWMGFLAGELLSTDYGGGGVLLIVLFYLLRDWPLTLAVVLVPFLYVCYHWLEVFGVLALIPIYLYNGKPGRRLPGLVGKYGFYLYYPLHLLVLDLLRLALYGY